eukprot:12832085-Prorocentrum_lima.AAC.1
MEKAIIVLHGLHSSQTRLSQAAVLETSIAVSGAMLRVQPWSSTANFRLALASTMCDMPRAAYDCSVETPKQESDRSSS